MASTRLTAITPAEMPAGVDHGERRVEVGQEVVGARLLERDVERDRDDGGGHQVASMDTGEGGLHLRAHRLGARGGRTMKRPTTANHRPPA